MNRCDHDWWIRFYMYDFMYVDNDTIPKEEYFPGIKTIFENYKKTPNPGSVPKHWLIFSYIHSYYHKLDLTFMEQK